jgi:hypothetical protein
MNEFSNAESLEQANRNVELAEATERLFKNKDFKKVIIDLYIRETLITSSLDYASVPESYRNRLLEKIASRGNLNSFLMELVEEGRKAKEFIEYVNQQEKGE